MVICMGRKQVFLVTWKPAQFMIHRPQGFQLVETPQWRYLNALFLTHQKEQSRMKEA